MSATRQRRCFYHFVTVGQVIFGVLVFAFFLRLSDYFDARFDLQHPLFKQPTDRLFARVQFKYDELLVMGFASLLLGILFYGPWIPRQDETLFVI